MDDASAGELSSHNSSAASSGCVHVEKRRPSEIGNLPKPATHDGTSGHAEDVLLQLFMQPLEDYNYPTFCVSAMPRTSARVLKAKIRWRCGGLSSVKDDHIRLLYKGVELPDDGPVMQHLPVDDRTMAQQEGSLEIKFLILHGQAHSEATSSNTDLHVGPGVPCPAELEQILSACAAGFQAGMRPILTSSGTGGCYFLRGSLSESAEDVCKLAVFKPKDEEAFCPQNPRGFEGPENSHGFSRPGVRSAHRAVREVASYLLDHGGFAGVPMTTLAYGKHPDFVRHSTLDTVVWKVGSLQACVDTSETADNFGKQMYSDADVHRIGILDVRIANMDRNYGNLLVKVIQDNISSRRLQLVPIDHGYSLPDRLGIELGDVVWMSWPQSRQPFGKEELDYIASLKGAKDARMLAEKLGLERAGLRLLEVTTCWLQVAADRRLTLHQIGSALYRNGSISAVEKVLTNCVDLVFVSLLQSNELQRSSSAATSAVALKAPSSIKDAFARYDNSGVELEWTSKHEDAFRRSIGDSLERLAREQAPPQPPQPLSPPPPARPDEAEPIFSLDALPRRCSGAYVPPQRRRQMVAQ